MSARHWFVCAFVLVACGGDDGPSSRSSVEYELFETTKVLDDETRAALESVSADGRTLTFSTATAQLDAVEPPQVLLSQPTDVAPAGLLRQVVSIDRSGGRVVVDTDPATVFHAFRR